MTPDPEPHLLPEELEIWRALKQLSGWALAQVEADIEFAAGLSGADFGILSRLEDLGGGVLLQHELARSLGWNKARLSHQLTRMHGRGLLRRDVPTAGRGVLVLIQPPGREAIATARPVHAASIRRHLLRHLKAGEAHTLVDVVRRLQVAGSDARSPRSTEGQDERDR